MSDDGDSGGESCAICGHGGPTDDELTVVQRIDVDLCMICASGYDEGIIDISDVSEKL